MKLKNSTTAMGNCCAKKKVPQNAFETLAQKFGLYNRMIQLKPLHIDKMVLTIFV